MLNLHDILELSPDALVAGGAAIARVDGFPLFVSGLYPGDVARVEIVEVKKGFARGEVIELLKPGASRRSSPCSIADRCGGCDWTSLRLDEQLRWKERIVVESLERIGKFNRASLPPIRLHPSPLSYRMRSRLHVANGEVGFFASKSNDVVPLAPDCEVVGPLTTAYLDDLRTAARRIGEGEIIVIETGEHVTVARAGDRKEIEIDAGGHQFSLSTDSFFQVNRHLHSTMLGLVTQIASKVTPRRTAYDLYGGVGFFALPLAGIFANVVTVEDSRESSSYARRNAKRKKSIEAVSHDVEYFLEKPRRAAECDFVFVDPPRSGLFPGFAEAIDDFPAKTICYLSCDPVTFARDVQRLARFGWRVDELHLLDLFPNTHHVETLSSLIRV